MEKNLKRAVVILIPKNSKEVMPLNQNPYDTNINCQACK